MSIETEIYLNNCNNIQLQHNADLELKDKLHKLRSLTMNIE